jgi:nicotinamide-nucleotide amidase
MFMSITAAILSIGTELTSGLTVDTNSAHISTRLAELGIVTLRHVTVGDHVDDIAAAIAAESVGADVLVISGGLGPTEDDLTRQALAGVLGVELVLDEKVLEELTLFFERRGWSMNPTNRVQALRPAGTETLANPVGTAPGIYARVGKAEVFVVPGVPSEMRTLIDLHVLPRLAGKAGSACLVFRTVHTFGAGESAVGAEIRDLMHRSANPLVGTTVADGVVSIRVRAAAVAKDQAEKLADQRVEEIRRRLGKLVYGVDEETLPAVLGQLLRQRAATLSIAESCTGGWLGKLLTEPSGASDYFLGGLICYDNRVKRDFADVDEAMIAAHGAVSEQVAGAMAQNTRRRFGTTYALSITGIAGPTGGSGDKPVGLVYTALDGPTGLRLQRNQLPGPRDRVRLRSALMAMNMLRLELEDSTRK